MSDAYDPSARVGSVLANTWTVDRVLGQGSVAVVYAAHGAAGNQVALKVLHPHTAKLDDLCSRFLREGKLANSIAHPGVVRVFEGGVTDDDCPWLAMELLDGETIEARWERKGQRLAIAEVMWVADQILDILVVAHKKGIVHRDIKPENVFLTVDRKVKLLDFGIARLRDVTATRFDQTQFGQVLGTPAFMAPEQARGDTTEIGIESDLWAVGATMYTLLSGRLVHEENDLDAQLRASGSREAPSLSVVAPEVPSAVVGLVDYALVFDKKKRWPSARAMQNALRMAYRETKPRSFRTGPVLSAGGLGETGPIPLDLDSEPVIRVMKPEAPPVSMRRPPSRS